MSGTLPAPNPEKLARWLLATECESHNSFEERVMAAIHVYERLRVHFSAFVGTQGFDALWARALYLARRTFPWNNTAASPAAPVSVHQIDGAAQGRTTAEACVVFEAIFTHFLSLLFTFIGADLGFRLLQQQWPALLAPTAADSDQEAHI